ncbi:MAG: penicillin-binding transpeptidase domain-containing protein [Acidobacteriota bacterium]|nr:penicillin-binding transpeptidase domain-containing protein [Acidobacteriota bacterium]
MPQALQRSSSTLLFRPFWLFLLGVLLTLSAPLHGDAPRQDRSAQPSTTGAGAQRGTPTSLAQAFGDLDGIFLATDLAGEEIASFYSEGTAERATERFPPCSTFKVPHALIALDLGVVTEESSTKAWDGEAKAYDVWERDQDLASAIRYSVVWYFQQIAQEVNPQRMQTYLDRLDYGNRDISGGQTRFWLTSSLEISPAEQIRFLRQLYKEELPIAKEHQLAVQQMLVQREEDGYQFSGKTGSCLDEKDGPSGWFIGHLRTPEGQEVVFATHVAGETAKGTTARKISLELLRELGLLPAEDEEKDAS